MRQKIMQKIKKGRKSKLGKGERRGDKDKIGENYYRKKIGKRKR